jgi:hypothetical protein
MSLLTYLNSYYYTSETLCQGLKITSDVLFHWQESGIFEKPSYSIQNKIVSNSYSGIYECEEYTDYYPRGSVLWGRTLIKHSIHSSVQAFELFYAQYTSLLNSLAQKGFETRAEEFNDDLAERIQNSWQQFLCSKYGVITQNGNIEEIVYTDFAKAVVNELTDNLSVSSIQLELRPRLTEALKLLNQVLSHNAEHEKNFSLRERYINTLINKYDLSIK